MPDPTGNEPPGAAPDGEEDDDRIPGDWQDVKRYLIGLLSLVFLAVIVMFVVAVYEYRAYHGSKAEDTKMIPAKQDVMRQGTLPERLRKYHKMKPQPSAAPSAQ